MDDDYVRVATRVNRVNVMEWGMEIIGPTHLGWERYALSILNSLLLLKLLSGIDFKYLHHRNCRVIPSCLLPILLYFHAHEPLAYDRFCYDTIYSRKHASRDY